MIFFFFWIISVGNRFHGSIHDVPDIYLTLLGEGFKIDTNFLFFSIIGTVVFAVQLLIKIMTLFSQILRLIFEHFYLLFRLCFSFFGRWFRCTILRGGWAYFIWEDCGRDVCHIKQYYVPSWWV